MKKIKIENLETLKVRKPSPIKLLPFSLYLAMEKLSPVGTSLAKRYGYIYVDQDDDGNGTRQRRKKKSFDWYKKVIATNGEDLA